VDNTTAVLLAAALGVAGGLGGTWLLTRHQRELARIERQKVAYVDAVMNLHQILDLVGMLTFGPGIRKRADVIAEQSPRDSARASIAVLGSKQVKVLHANVHDAFLEWERFSNSFPLGWPQGDPPPPWLDECRTGLAERWRGVRDAVQALEGQMNGEMTK
jgi:hypothetical protein